VQQFLIAVGVGYFAGSGVINAMYKNETLAKLFEPTGLGAAEISLISGGILYGLKPLPEGMNGMVSGFLVGAGIKGLTQ